MKRIFLIVTVIFLIVGACSKNVENNIAESLVLKGFQVNVKELFDSLG